MTLHRSLRSLAPGKRRLKKPLVSGLNTGLIAPLNKSLFTAVYKSWGVFLVLKDMGVQFSGGCDSHSNIFHVCMMHNNCLAGSATVGKRLPGEPPPIALHLWQVRAGPLAEESFAWKWPCLHLLLPDPLLRPCWCRHCWKNSCCCRHCWGNCCCWH